MHFLCADFYVLIHLNKHCKTHLQGYMFSVQQEKNLKLDAKKKKKKTMILKTLTSGCVRLRFSAVGFFKVTRVPEKSAVDVEST